MRELAQGFPTGIAIHEGVCYVVQTSGHGRGRALGMPIELTDEEVQLIRGALTVARDVGAIGSWQQPTVRAIVTKLAVRDARVTLDELEAAVESQQDQANIQAAWAKLQGVLKLARECHSRDSHNRTAFSYLYDALSFTPKVFEPTRLQALRYGLAVATRKEVSTADLAALYDWLEASGFELVPGART